MQLDSLANISNENSVAPTPITDLCKRVLFRQSECQLCADICPTNAISLPFGPELSSECINCGLCEIACPTEAFEGLHNTDQMLLEMLDEQSDTIINDHKLYVHCHQAEADYEGSVSVKCLGNMTENSLMAMMGADVKVLMSSTGKCNDCKMCEGMGLFKKAAASYTKLSKMIYRSAITINLREKQKISRPSSAVSRRDFIRSIGNGVAKQTAKVVVSKEQQIRELLKNCDEVITQKRPSPRREILKALLAESLLSEKINNEFDKSEHSTFLGKKMIVDEANCVGCGVCVNVCPTGALVKEVNESELTRTINHSLCTNCDICSEACPQDVIRFKQAYGLEDIMTDNKEVVAIVALNACCICGEIIPVSEGKVCTTCQKRQVVPMFM